MNTENNAKMSISEVEMTEVEVETNNTIEILRIQKLILLEKTEYIEHAINIEKVGEIVCNIHL